VVVRASPCENQTESCCSYDSLWSIEKETGMLRVSSRKLTPKQLRVLMIVNPAYTVDAYGSDNASPL